MVRDIKHVPASQVFLWLYYTEWFLSEKGLAILTDNIILQHLDSLQQHSFSSWSALCIFLNCHFFFLKKGSIKSLRTSAPHPMLHLLPMTRWDIYSSFYTPDKLGFCKSDCKDWNQIHLFQ